MIISEETSMRQMNQKVRQVKGYTLLPKRNKNYPTKIN